MVVAVVPARGGSKRIPRKNAREFCGRPIMSWPIQTAIDSGIFDRVVVSTDDEEIAEIAEMVGAEVPFLRSKALSDDFTTTTSVISDAISRLAIPANRASCVCCLYPTAALILSSDLIDGYRKWSKGDSAFVIGARRIASEAARAFVEDRDGLIDPLASEFASVRTQDLPDVYVDAGQFYFASAADWFASRSILGSTCAFVEMPADRAIDIDTEKDWLLAEEAMVRSGLSEAK